MSEQSLSILASLRRRLQATLRRSLRAEIAFGAVLTAGLGALLWLLFTALEASFWLPPSYRDILLGGFAIVLLSLAGWFVLRPGLQLINIIAGSSEEELARHIGSSFPEVSDRLLTVLQLAEGRGSPAPAPLVDHAVQRLGKEVEQVPFEQVEDYGKVRRTSRYAAIPAVGLLLFLLAAPSSFTGASHRLLSPGAFFQRPAPFELSVAPGDVAITEGDSLVLTAQIGGSERPDRAVLDINQKGETHVQSVPLTFNNSDRNQHTLRDVRAPLRYRVKAGPVATRWHQVTIHRRPIVRTLQVRLDYPSYTRLPDRRLSPNVGDVSALPGTQVHIDAALAGAPVRRAHIVFDDGRRDSLTVADGRAKGSFTLQQEGSYHIRLESGPGTANKSPIGYRMELSSDAPPSIVQLAPDDVAELDGTMQRTLRLHVTDDYGFAALRLKYRLAESRYGDTSRTFDSIELPFAAARLDQQIDYEWMIQSSTSLDLVPGDVIEYYVQVWDNNRVAGYRSARTPTHRLVLPSLAEKYESLEEQQDSTRAHLKELQESSENLHRQFEEMERSMQRANPSDWENKRQVGRLKQQHQQMQEQADRLSRALEKMTRSMEENSLVEPQTLEMYKELQKVVEEVQSPELQKALEQLQKAMENMNPRLMQEALQNFKFDEQSYQQRLERTLSLFKKIRMQQELDEAARRAQELAERERQMAEESEKIRREQEEKSDDARSEDKERSTEENRDGQGQNRDGEQRTSDGENREEQNHDQTKENRQGQQPGEQNEQQRNQSDRAEDSRERREKLAEQQKQAQEELNELMEELKKTQEQMKESRTAPRKEMQQLMKQLQQQNPSQQMQRNQQSLKQNQMQKAAQQQRQLQQQFQNMQQQLQQMQQSMKGKRRNINMAGVRDALSDVLQLSSQQEDLQATVSAATPDNPQLRDHARRQSEMADNLTTVSDSLQKLAKNIPQMRRAVQEEAGRSLQSMQEATSTLTERQTSQAAGMQQRSMMHLNELALMLADLLEQMKKSGGGKGGSMSMQQMRQQMQQMAGQQQQLNQQIQQMLNDMQGQRLSTNQQQRLQQMARQQEALRKQLQELSQNEAASQMLGDLQKIAEQMKESIEEMQQRSVNRETVRRQRQIHQRLLDAQRSIRKQGQKNERKSETGDTINRESPQDLPQEEQIDRLRRALIRAIESGYAPEYEEMIKRYFEMLQRQDEAPAAPQK